MHDAVMSVIRILDGRSASRKVYSYAVCRELLLSVTDHRKRNTLPLLVYERKRDRFFIHEPNMAYNLS